MPQTDTYALGLHALKEACIKENNPNHPQFTLSNRRKIYRPLTFKENVQARVENYETTYNSDGSERTLDERLSLITGRWNDSCTAIAYNAGTNKFKVVPISEHLITLNSNFNEDFIQIDYDNIVGPELDISKSIYNHLMSKYLVLKHEGWLAALEDDIVLLKSYTEIIFTELKRKYKRTEGMTFWVQKNISADELRALSVNYLKGNSNADGYSSFITESDFLRRIPTLDTK